MKRTLSVNEKDYLEDLFQDSKTYILKSWNKVKRDGEFNYFVIEIMNAYEEQLINLFKIKSLSELDALFVDYGPKEWFLDNVEAEIS